MPKLKARSDGRYQGKILVGTIDGQPRYKYVYGKTQKEVQDKLAVLRVELGKGADLTQPMSLSFWIRRWLARAEQQQTAEWYDTCAVRAAWWEDQLGREDISQLTTADLEDALLRLAACNPRTNKPSSKKTIREYASIIRRVYALAAQNRVITFDPSEYLTLSKNAPQSHREALTDAQIAAIRSTPHPCQIPSLIMIYTGLRLGELAALTWSDVDLQNGYISVTKSYNFKSGAVKTPKTSAGERKVPIPAVLLPYLQSAPHTVLLVCPDRGGGPYTRSRWRDQLAAYSSLLGFTVRAHELRHTYCTILYEAGVDVLSAQRLMGHADSATTMGIYTHLRDQQQAASIARLDAYLSGDGVKKVSK